MSVASRLWMRAKHLVGGVRAFHLEREGRFREMVGASTVIALDTFVVISFMGMSASQLARGWRSDIAHTPRLDAVSIVTQFPMRCVYTAVFAAAWTYLVDRWLRYMRWPRWWALPYVFLLLCPMAWVL